MLNIKHGWGSTKKWFKNTLFLYLFTKYLLAKKVLQYFKITLLSSICIFNKCVGFFFISFQIRAFDVNIKCISLIHMACFLKWVTQTISNNTDRKHYIHRWIHFLRKSIEFKLISQGKIMFSLLCEEYYSQKPWLTL